MKEIVNRLHENRQIELAKSILESNGYKVSKKLEESSEYKSWSWYEVDLSYDEHKELEKENGVSEEEWRDYHEKAWKTAAELLDTTVDNLHNLSNGDGEIPEIKNLGSPIIIDHENDHVSDRLWLAEIDGITGVHARDGYGFSSFYLKY